MDPGESLSATWPPLGTPSRAHASQAAPRAATTPPPCAAPLQLRPLAVESTAPSHYIPHPGAPWPIKTPSTPQSRPFPPFFLLPPLRHGRRDPALPDQLAQPTLPPPTTVIASPPPRYAPRARNRTQTASRRRSPFAPPPASSGSPRTGQLRRRPSPTATPEASTSSRGARARLVPPPRALLHLQRRRTEQPTRHQRRRA